MSRRRRSGGRVCWRRCVCRGRRSRGRIGGSWRDGWSRRIGRGSGSSRSWRGGRRWRVCGRRGWSGSWRDYRHFYDNRVAVADFVVAEGEYLVGVGGVGGDVFIVRVAGVGEVEGDELEIVIVVSGATAGASRYLVCGSSCGGVPGQGHGGSGGADGVCDVRHRRRYYFNRDFQAVRRGSCIRCGVVQRVLADGRGRP